MFEYMISREKNILIEGYRLAIRFDMEEFFENLKFSKNYLGWNNSQIYSFSKELANYDFYSKSCFQWICSNLRVYFSSEEKHKKMYEEEIENIFNSEFNVDYALYEYEGDMCYYETKLRVRKMNEKEVDDWFNEYNDYESEKFCV